MKKLRITAAFFFLICTLVLNAQTIKPLNPAPSVKQLKWQEMEYYFFIHFGPNTFTGLEWGHGDEHAEVFNPEKLDCRQWCRIAKAAGAKGIIITAKHHDGFCLWPSAYSTHTVRESNWRNGKGDVLKELSNACQEYGLKMGVYLSPWDRNHPKYGTDDYNTVFINMMKEVVSRYGPFFEFWWDGANGEGPNGKKQVYNWNAFRNTLKTIAPNTVVFSDIGPHVRWVGNERGIAGKTCWSMLDTMGFKPGIGAPAGKVLNEGNIDGKAWIPAECDVSIRPGWFYHKEEDTKVKTPQELFQLYLKSVGRNATLLLNIPPDQNGLFTAYDSISLMEFKKLRDKSFKNSLLRNASVRYNGKNVKNILNDNNNKSYFSLGNTYEKNAIHVEFSATTAINCIVLQEPVQMGQRVKSFTITLQLADGTAKSVEGTTIGYKRILTFPTEQVKKITIQITGARAMPLISTMDIFKIDEELIEKI